MSTSLTLTREQILAMPAGERLDALVAELIMGEKAWIERRGEYSLCVVQRSGKSEPWLSVQRPTPERYTAVSCSDAVKIGFFGEGFSRYSRDIAHAWQVVEKIHQTKPPMDRYSDSGPWFSVDSPWSGNEFWIAGWRDYIQYEGQGMIHDFHAVAETAPLAICRAALLTKLKAEVKA